MSATCVDCDAKLTYDGTCADCLLDELIGWLELYAPSLPEGAQVVAKQFIARWKTAT